MIKKIIVSRGAYHEFRNIKDGSLLYVKCTPEEYARLGEVGGSQYNPTLEGYVWVCSADGCPEIMTLEGLKIAVDGLKNGEYVELPDGSRLEKASDVISLK